MSLGGIVGFFQEGGAFMYPILIVFALGVAIAIERWIYLTSVRRFEPCAVEKDRAFSEGR